MGESSSRRVMRQSSENIGTIVLRKFPRENLSKFGRVVWALWPDDPTASLAKRALCTKRHANLLISGQRKPNARAALAVYAEIIG
jgi:hypothetical protein